MWARQSTRLCGTLILIAWLATPSWLTGQQPAAVATPRLTPEQMETFLLKARIARVKSTGKGITNSLQATLSDGQITHDAHVQTVDISQTLFTPARGRPELNFRDTYRYNIAAYRLSLLLGLSNVPLAVERNYRGKDASFVWWVDDVLMDDAGRLKAVPPHWRPTRTAGQIHVMRVFDELISNSDRNVGNLLWTTDGTMWMIDHTRAFRLQEELKAPKLLLRWERSLADAMRKLSKDQLTTTMGEYLNPYEIDSLFARRDAIVKLFDEMIAQRREAAVYFTLER